MDAPLLKVMGQAMEAFSFFVCPNCGTKSGEMRLTNQIYTPTPKELEILEPGLEPIQHEVLLCKCGCRHSWFDLREVTTYAN